MSPEHQHRTRHDSPTERVTVDDSEAPGLYTVTADISSDTTARDGDAFSPDRLAGFRDQINSDGQPVPLMVDHGKSSFAGDARYSALGRIGTVEDARLEDSGGTTHLRADMAVADPDEFAEDAGDIEAALRYLKFQAETMGLSFSVGWSENSGGRDVPGDADLLEVSVVAVPSDTEATSTNATDSAVPEKAARGFQAIAESDDTDTTADSARVGFQWLHRREDGDDRDDVERVREAFTQLGSAPRLAPHTRRSQAKPGIAIQEEVTPENPAAKAHKRLRELFRPDADDDTLRARIARVRGDSPHRTGKRAELAEAVTTIERDRRRHLSGRDATRDTPYLDALADLMDVAGEVQ